MAPPLQVPQGAQLTLYWSIGGQLALNKIGVIVNTAPTFDQALINRIASTIKAAWTAGVAPLCPPTTELLKVGIRDVRTAHLNEFRDSLPSEVGTGLGDPLPKQAALCITVRTAQAGKSARGRIYGCGFDETVNDTAGHITSAAQLAVLSFYADQVGGALITEGMAIGVMTRPQEAVVVQEITTHADGTTTIRTISRQTAKPGRVLAATQFESRDAEWETQRRRANGRGSAVVAQLAGGIILQAA